MKDIKWLVNRLKAMKPQEMVWRVEQKRLQNKEQVLIYSLHMPVTEVPLRKDISQFKINIDRLSVNWNNKKWSLFSSLDLFGVFNYEDYKKKWNAGFQTNNTWPEGPFSPTINISQRVDIGDIRTNWELNRHFQFAALAKNYYCSKEEKYLCEFKDLFIDWNKHNLFLHGVEWTSAMELAIRINSWVYALAFLKKAGCEDQLLLDIEHGILNMTNYIVEHRARFSSANNHLIIEMYAVALVGILTGYALWRDEALKVLTEELSRQNYPDGVNKEMSLHYQSFVMEAYGLLWLLMMKNNIEIPAIWKKYLSAMSEFIVDSTDDNGMTMEFGDSDEGKILDLNGMVKNHYQYVLNLMGCLLDKRYTDAPWHENLLWLVPEKMKTEKEKYIPALVCSRKEGGYTFLRSKDRRVLIGIDHADLGFGSIAAHGHADALSFQMFIDGCQIFVDSGTYNYHVTPEDRNYFRSTMAHNTVMIDGQEQSEILGPFIWGKRSHAYIEGIEENNGTICVTAINEGTSGVHKRLFAFNDNSLMIQDEIMGKAEAFFHFFPYSGYTVKENVGNIQLCGRMIDMILNVGDYKVETGKYSPKYNECIQNEYIRVSFLNCLKTEIHIK